MFAIKLTIVLVFLNGDQRSEILTGVPFQVSLHEKIRKVAMDTTQFSNNAGHSETELSPPIKSHSNVDFPLYFSPNTVNLF